MFLFLPPPPPPPTPHLLFVYVWLKLLLSDYAFILSPPPPPPPPPSCPLLCASFSPPTLTYVFFPEFLVHFCACGGLRRNEIGLSPGLALNSSSFFFPSPFPLLFFLPCFALYFHSLSAILAHSAELGFFSYPSSTGTIARSRDMTACLVARHIHAKISPVRDLQRSSWGTKIIAGDHLKPLQGC